MGSIGCAGEASLTGDEDVSSDIGGRFSLTDNRETSDCEGGATFSVDGGGTSSGGGTFLSNTTSSFVGGGVVKITFGGGGNSFDGGSGGGGGGEMTLGCRQISIDVVVGGGGVEISTCVDGVKCG